MRTVLGSLAVAICGALTIASTSIEQSPGEVGRGPEKRYAAVAFDYLVLFNPDSVVSAVDQIAPGKRREYVGCATRLEQRDIVFAAFAGWDAAGAKSFGYPTVWVNRLNQPLEELGLRPDRTVTDLNGLLGFVLRR